jgi:AraC-like DNA-binding protein
MNGTPMELEKAFLLIVLSLSLWSMLALLLDRRGYLQVNRLFAFLLLSFCVPQIYFYSRYVYPPDGLFLLALAAQAVIWLKGPLLLAMVRLLIGQPLGVYWPHFLPFPLALVGLVLQPQWVFEWGLGGLAHALIYLLIALSALGSHKARLATIYKGYKNSALYWLLFVVLGMLLVVFIDAILMLVAYVQRDFLISAIKGMTWLISTYLLVLAFFSVYRPALFFHQDGVDVRAQPDTAAHAESECAAQSQATESNVNAEKIWRELDESLANALGLKLHALMTQEHCYRQNDLSLAVLAARLGVSVHQTSELLNVYVGASFYEYLNRFRLEYASKLLADPECQWRILDIAFESGFSNKNSFYRSFRDVYGITPAAYRAARIDAELGEAS